jgi:ATP-dependent helicase/nuclease subunit A
MATNPIHDLTERKLALDPAKSFIVQAPAGSGKTTLLVERYLTLLEKTTNPEEITAITFTRKAAHEMRTRIIEKLDPVKHKHIIQNPHRLRIQTIDAFCAYLISQAPIFTQINSKFKIIQNEEAEIYYGKAARRILENLADSEYALPLEQLLLHLDNDFERTEYLFVTMLKSREQWLPHVVGLKNVRELRQKMELALCEILEENLERTINLFPKEHHSALAAILKTIQDHHDDLPQALQNITITNGLFKKEISTWQEIAGILLTQKYSWRKIITKDQGFPAATSKDHPTKQEIFKEAKKEMVALLENLSQHENLRMGLENLLLSPPPNYSEKEWQIIESLLELLPLLAAHLKVIFNENLVTDHAEISMAALSVLGDEEAPSEFALNLDYRLKHLLIDEFQDTSLAHFRLIEKLITTWQPNDGRTIFIVGDPMQSIYRFREAEVGLFLRVVRDGISDLKLQPLTLNTNFRSAQNLIDWNNNNFAKVLPTLPDISLGAVPFRPSQGVTNDTGSTVQIKLMKNGDDLTEASEIIRIITKIREKNPTDTIAILVKARKHLEQIIPALRKTELNYQAFELEALDDTLVIRDLFALTRALFNLADRIAWIGILRAPWCGLLLKDLHQIANGPSSLIWDNICNYHELNLSPDGEKRILKLQTILSPIIELCGRTPWRGLVEKAWLSLGGPATLSHEGELKYAEIYLNLLNNELDVAVLQKKLHALYTPTTISSQIQVMTIHKAKGLEFDHVIIPGVNRPTRFDDKKLLLWFERPKLHQGSNLLIAPITMSANNCNNAYEYLQSVESKKSFYENGRLLYVAMTRAKKSTYILGNFTDTIQAGSLLEQFKTCFDEKWVNENLSNTLINNQAAIEKNNSGNLMRFQNSWQSPVTIDLPTSENKPVFDLVDDQAAILGTVIHQCLKQISEGNKNKINIMKLLRQEGYVNIDEGIKLINEAIEKTEKDERGKWLLLTKHKDAQSELALTTRAKGKFVSYVVDRTFIDDKGFRWIIDYKTSTPGAHENVEKFLDKEAGQYHQQLNNYAKALHAIDPSKNIKLGLYFPLFGGWKEITYDCAT